MSAEQGLYVPADPNITRFSTGHHVQQVEAHDGFLVVNDPQLGGFVIGNNNSDNIYFELFTTDDAYRGLGYRNFLSATFMPPYLTPATSTVIGTERVCIG